jgi:hypothetical protein
MANISTYPLGTPASSDLIPGTQKYTDANGETKNLTKNFTVSQLAAFANSYDLGYTVYTALVNQDGTADPTQTILQNTTGQTLTWARTSAGLYTVTSGAALFTADKTIVFFESNHIYTQLNWTRTSTTVITVNTNEEDDRISNAPFEVRIYS